MFIFIPKIILKTEKNRQRCAFLSQVHRLFLFFNWVFPFLVQYNRTEVSDFKTRKCAGIYLCVTVITQLGNQGKKNGTAPKVKSFRKNEWKCHESLPARLELLKRIFSGFGLFMKITWLFLCCIRSARGIIIIIIIKTLSCEFHWVITKHL
jgi:hypothetical protein